MLCLVLLACENPDYIYFFHETIEQDYECCEGEHCARVSMSYPRFKPINPTLSRVNELIREKLFSYLEVGDPEMTPSGWGTYDEFCKSYKEMVGNGSVALDWELDTQVVLTQQGQEILSLRFTHYYFTGGAHPNTVVDYLMFDLTEPGKILEPHTLVLNEEALLEKVEQSFREFHEVEDGISLAEDGRFFLDRNSLFLPAAMGYEGDEWVMVYNTYEVAPYAMGQTVLSFPMDELRGIVRGWR